MTASQILLRYMGSGSCWPETRGPAVQLSRISIGLSRLEQISVCPVSSMLEVCGL